MPRPTPPLIGKRIGKLLVRKKVGTKKGVVYWEVECACGNVTTFPTSELSGRRRKSCGCMRGIRHGHCRESRSSTYNTWRGMRDRCNRPSCNKYENYGGRGIKVCHTWNVSFLSFVNDMGTRPRGKTLDRIDPNGNYELGNCRWATPEEQEANKVQPDIDEDDEPF